MTSRASCEAARQPRSVLESARPPACTPPDVVHNLSHRLPSPPHPASYPAARRSTPLTNFTTRRAQRHPHEMVDFDKHVRRGHPGASLRVHIFGALVDLHLHSYSVVFSLILFFSIIEVRSLPYSTRRRHQPIVARSSQSLLGSQVDTTCAMTTSLSLCATAHGSCCSLAVGRYSSASCTWECSSTDLRAGSSPAFSAMPSCEPSPLFSHSQG